jgi:hypothetical protein
MTLKSKELSTIVANILFLYIPSESGSSVSIVTGYGLGDRGSIPDRGGGFLLYSLRPSGSGTHPVSHNGYRGPSPGVNPAGACC